MYLEKEEVKKLPSVVYQFQLVLLELCHLQLPAALSINHRAHKTGMIKVLLQWGGRVLL